MEWSEENGRNEGEWNGVKRREARKNGVVWREEKRNKVK